ncbi:MAG TPA: IPT/TIG domain-containing protein, partial [Vicinamibacterales bacterium]
MSDWRRSSLHTVAIIAGAMLSGCAMAIDTPKNDGDSVCSPVQVGVSWQGTVTNNTFSATLDNVDVTPQFAVDYGNRRASAQLTAPLGPHTLVAAGQFLGFFGSTSNGNATRTFRVPGLTVAANPTSLTLAKNSSNTPLTVVVSGCPGAVNVTLAGLPTGVTATPPTVQVNVPSNPAFNLQALATATTGRYTVTINATAPGQMASTMFTIDLGTPTISAVNPAMQPKGGSVTISGTGFDAVCSRNTVRIGGVDVMPATCSPAGTSLSIAVPSQASYGATPITVSVGGLTSNGVPFTVSRQSGAFVDITDDVSNQISSGRTCTGGPGGNVRLDVTGTGPFTATFVRLTTPATPIGSFQFRKDTPQINAYAGATLEEILNLGGAGFSLCSLGVVLDADARSYAQRVLALTLIDLQTGTKGTPYGFGYYSPAVQNGNTYYYTRSAPTIFRSPDGTIILVEHPSITTAFRVAVGVIDAVKLGQAGQLISTVETSATQ